MGDEPPDFKKLAQVVEAVNMSDFILGLPMHFNTLVGEAGIGMSSGQKQRILIARAIYKDPDYLFFDEATNSLDAENENIIVKNLKEIYKRKTVVIIAHRLSTVKDADKIIVIDNGIIIESGSHDELVKMNGHYLKLVKNQLELGS